jgi:cell fate regulator YaaT (PSP1 superfamily)
MPKFVVRYGVMRTLGVMQTRENLVYSRGTQVIARTDRGIETGIVLCEATPQALAQMTNPAQGTIQREMTAGDSLELSKILAKQRDEFQIVKKHVAASGLDMQLVDVERIFGGERVVIYYLSENRIDFRDLVKAIAADFQTRIEMKQIGSRDEAKLLADYGDCGKPVCCNTHLSEMPPVSMKMAKLQKATLDPTKISGRCGRLKCCLRYEYDTYEALQKDLPPIGSDVITARGRCRVLAQEILAQQLLVETEDRRRIMIPAAEILTVLSRGSGSATSDNSRRERRPPQPEQSGQADAPRGERGKSGPPKRERRPDPRRDHTPPTEVPPPQENAPRAEDQADSGESPSS